LRTRNTEAISPIFATLIILAVITVLFIPVFIWATGMSSETEDSWQLSGLIATERIVIEEVNLKANTNNCTIYVRNIGKTTVSVDNVYISLSDGTGSLHVYTKSGTPTLTTSPNSVIQGDLITVTIPDLDLLSPTLNQTYTVKVFTHRGVGDTYQVVT
jgi:archaellum component FlaG (FlaF/FlaG flagellin family)